MIIQTKMEELIALLLALVMVCGLVACGNSSAPAATEAPKAEAPAAEAPAAEAPAGKIKVGFVTQSLTNASQAYAWTQFQKYAPEYGFEVTLFDEDYDAQNGVAAISTCIAEGYTAICLNPTDPAALVPALKEAKEAGIKVVPTKWTAFVISGVTATLAGVLLSSRMNTGNSVYGDTTGMMVNCGVVIGGTSFAGGEGGVIQSFIGLMAVQMLSTCLSALSVDSFWQKLIEGLMIVAIIGADCYSRKRKRENV